MSERLEGLCLILLDLARRQKAAVEAGNVEEASVLALPRPPTGPGGDPKI